MNNQSKIKLPPLTIIHKNKVDIDCKYNGRSSDYIFPSLINGCGYTCSYCTMRRYNTEHIAISDNYLDMFSKCSELLSTLQFPKIPNQTDNKYYTFDIGVNCDLPLLAKFLDIDYIWKFFKTEKKAKATFATKYVNSNLLNYDPADKIRIRFSLMPQRLSSVFEPRTTLIEDRIKAVNDFAAAGYDVHLNFSPVIYGYDEYEDWNKNLFQQVDDLVENKYKFKIHCEVIFLTHNQKLHEYNLKHNIKGERHLWRPDIQEEKVASYGTIAVRYEYGLKKKLVQEWKEIHDSIIPWNKIRYIF